MSRLVQTLLIAIAIFVLEITVIAPGLLMSDSGQSAFCMIPILFLLSIAIAAKVQQYLASWKLVYGKRRSQNSGGLSEREDRYPELAAAAAPYWLILMEHMPVPLIQACLRAVPKDEPIELATCGMDTQNKEVMTLIIVTPFQLVVGRIKSRLNVLTAISGETPEIVSIPLSRVTSVEFRPGRLISTVIIHAANLEDISMESAFKNRDRAEAFVRMLSSKIARR